MSYTGFGMYQPPAPKKDRRPLWVGLGVLAGVLVIGGTTTAVVVSNTGSTTTTPATSTTAAPDDAKWLVVANTAAKVEYKVPDSWKPVAGSSTAGGVALSKFAESRRFQCQGLNMIQAHAASGSSRDTDAEAVATKLASVIATTSYTVQGKAPKLGKPVVKPVELEGVQGVSVTVVATPTAVSPCYAPTGEVTAIAYRTGSGSTAVALNVAKGGPHVAEGPTDDEVIGILESVRPT